MKSGERELWSAVIDQALIDATKTQCTSLNARLERDRAREWLTKPSRDLNQVCALAGLDQCRVIAWAKEQIAATAKDDTTYTPRRRRRYLGHNPRSGEPAVYHHDGRSLTLREWSAALGVPRATLYDRLRRGYAMEHVLSPTSFNSYRGLGLNSQEQRQNRTLPSSQA